MMSGSHGKQEILARFSKRIINYLSAEPGQLFDEKSGSLKSENQTK